MKLIAQVKLLVTSEQAASLKETMEQANESCNRLSQWAWGNRTFGKFPIQKARYAAERIESGLTAQVVIRNICRVSSAYKSAFALNRLRVTQTKQANKERIAKGNEAKPLPVMTACEFKPTSAIAYDDRILNWYVERDLVSIWTVAGRMKLPFACGEHQRRLLTTRQGESDLAFVDGEFYLLATCNVDEPPVMTPDGTLGVDLGIVSIATDSEGNTYSGENINAVRRRNKRIRGLLQAKGTKNAKRHLKRAGTRESRHARWVNHNISKQIVSTALYSRKAIALEDLTNIRQRASAFNREMKWQMGNWAFAQLGAFITYKAKAAGVPVTFVDPRNTSRTCSACGHCDKANRKSQSDFLCISCGLCMNADKNAAINIGVRGNVTCPNDAPATG